MVPLRSQPGQGLTLNTLTLARGRVRVAIVGHAVTGDGAVGIGLVDVVGDRAAGVVVVARDIREGPGVSGVAAGGGVRGAAQIQPGQGLTLNTQTLARGRVRVAIVGHAVTGDGAVGIGLVDVVGDRAAGVVVVARDIREGPGVLG